MLTEINSNDLFGLDLSAKQMAEQLVNAYGKEDAERSLALRSGYEDIPPTIDEFIDDPYFLGEMVGEKLFPLWRDGLREIFPNRYFSPYQEISLTGAIGTGKTTVALIGSLYDICKMMHLKNPHDKYNIIKSDKIIYAVVNATKALSEGVLYEQMISWVESSKYFRSLMNKSKDKNKKGTLFPKNVDILAGSRFDQMMGRAIMGSILDELNFQNKISNQAYDNYNSIKARIESRFLRRGGKLPAHMWLVSSKSNDTGWLQNHLDTARLDPKSKIFENPVWDIFKYKQKDFYSGKKFLMFIGDRTRDPFIIENSRQVVGISDELLLEVPVEHEQNFRNDIHRSLQDLAGISTRSNFRFLSSVELIEECQIRDNPVTAETIILDQYDIDQTLIEFLKLDEIVKSLNPRFIHIDVGLRKDAAGIAATRYARSVTFMKPDIRTGVIKIVREPVYHTDFVMRIEAKPGQEVTFYKLRNFIYDLKNRGYPIASISTDGYQSTNLRQDISTFAGYDTKLISVDRTRDPYDHLKQIIVESRYSGVKHAIFNTEIYELLDMGDKIDHPNKGSKDVSDAVCGSVWNTYNNYEQHYNVMTAEEFVKGMEKHMIKEKNVYEKIAYTSLLANRNRMVF